MKGLKVRPCARENNCAVVTSAWNHSVDIISVNKFRIKFLLTLMIKYHVCVIAKYIFFLLKHMQFSDSRTRTIIYLIFNGTTNELGHVFCVKEE